MNSMTFQLGPIADAVDAALRDAQEQQVVKRIWRKDASLWKTDPKAQDNIRSSLGWLTVTDEMIGVADELAEYAELIRQRGFQYVMVCGMGGSSLCPEVLSRSFGQQPGFPELIVLDSTDPDFIGSLAHRIDVDKTLFIVASKSGSTIEPTTFYKFWYHATYLAQLNSTPGQNFIAITDPGSPLVEDASRLNFQRVFLNQADIGGRFSALSYFGMVPAALAGLDIRKLLSRAKNAEQSCSPAIPLESNPGIQLGAVLGEAFAAGRDKLTLVIDSRISSLGLWIEQLVAESTGKEGKGILPVAGETLGEPSVYGSDRLFVAISIGHIDPGVNQKLDALSAAGHPVVRRTLDDVYDLGSEFLIWEFATACAGWRLAINPFDQPDVQLAKQATNDALQVFKEQRQLPPHHEVAKNDLLSLFLDDEASSDNSVEKVLASHIAKAKAGDYIAVLAFVEETTETQELLRQLQKLLRGKTGCATTTGYGPRYLHSTGQLHKGGPDTGVFIEITANDETDWPIPGEDYSFSVLKQAQALGDFRALARKGRRVLGVDLGDNGEKALKRLVELI
jgi:transaldolase/glucose-6-phosphate isomerase